MKLRFYNARVLAMDGRPVFEGEVWTQDEKILSVREGTAQEEEKKKELWDEEIDCKGNLLMPGFKNAHTHSGMTLLRSFADDLPLQEWLNHQVFPVEARLTPEDIYTATKLAVLEYLTSGITSIFDMYLTPESIADACVEMGMRCVQVGGVNNFSQSVEMLEEMYGRLNHAHPLLSFQLGFHAEYTCTKELLERIADTAHKLKAPVYTHLCETAREVEECRERYGVTPVRLLDSLDMFRYGGGGYHCVHVTEEDMDIFVDRGLTVISNPGSNVKLASGIAPLQRFLERGIPVALGTDGPASNNCLDMFREMFLATGLAKIREKDASAVDASLVLKMATVNGAAAMGLPECACLKAGNLADIIMLDLQQPNMQPLNNIEKNIVYSGSKQNVCMTMIHGKVLYRDGVFHVGTDPHGIYRDANKIIARIKKSL